MAVPHELVFDPLWSNGSLIFSRPAGHTMVCVRKCSDFSPGRQYIRAGHRAGHLFATILFAGFGLALVALSTSFGLAGDPDVAALLLSPGACEAWQTRSLPRDSTHDGLNKSPLIREAERLALFLNPPQAKPARLEHRTASLTAAAATAQTPAPSIRPKLSTAKFTLHATSYYPSSPDESIALIDEPGKGLHWIRQGSRVGHVEIQEIRTGVIFLRDGQRSQEMHVEAVKTPGPTPGSQPPPNARYAKHVPSVTAAPINGISTQSMGKVRRNMVPLKSRPKRPGRGR
jgi:hypothetical protein